MTKHRGIIVISWYQRVITNRNRDRWATTPVRRNVANGNGTRRRNGRSERVVGVGLNKTWKEVNGDVWLEGVARPVEPSPAVME